MKILFDQGTPVPLRAKLLGHDVDTAYEKGWSNIQNGDLLKMAENAGYALLISTDQNMKYQQNLADRNMAILILLTTSWPRLKLQSERIAQIVNKMTLGEYQEFSVDLS